MKVVPIEVKSAEANQQHKDEILKVLSELREQIEDGTVSEFIATSATNDGTLQIHVACQEISAAVTMLEVGKHLIINGHIDV